MTASARDPVDVVVIGAGLCGLVAARHLQRAGRTCRVLEARNRVGGRIVGVPGIPSADLGPAWVWPHHATVGRLLEELGLETFVQPSAGETAIDQGPGQPVVHLSLPDQGSSPSRVIGGLTALVEAIARDLEDGTVMLGQRVERVALEVDRVRVSMATGDLEAGSVVVALPPALAARTLTLDPPLAPERCHVMESTPTWMSWSMKVALVYSRAPWTASGQSGAGMSRTGPVSQFYDATEPDARAEGPTALVGWVEPTSVRHLSSGERRRQVEAQAERMFGPLPEPTAYAECDWSAEPFTTVPDEAGYGSLALFGHHTLRDQLWGGRLHLAGSETSAVSPGYLDGAVARGESVARAVLDRV